MPAEKGQCKQLQYGGSTEHGRECLHRTLTFATKTQHQTDQPCEQQHLSHGHYGAAQDAGVWDRINGAAQYGRDGSYKQQRF
jgi:hypothetical protein